MKKSIDHFPRKTKIKISKEFTDHRGRILNISNKIFRSCVLIKSKKNSIRANHYHKKDWHYCYVLQGKLEYYFRKVGSNRKPKKEIFKTGDLFFTPPMVEHAFLFLVNTTFIALGRGSRKRINYEKDTVRIKLI